MTDEPSSAPRRRPPKGGYAKGEETREKIILAAVRVFAEEGFEGASTRRLAAEAGVTPPVLQYHFDSKEGLHRACGEYLVEMAMTWLGPAIDRARAALARPEPEAAIEALCDLLVHVAEIGMDKHDATIVDWRRFLTRAEIDSAGPAQIVADKGVSDPMFRITVDLVARATGLSSDSDEARLRAMFLTSQIGVLTARRARTLRAMGWDRFDEAAQARVKAILADNVRRLVGAKP